MCREYNISHGLYNFRRERGLSLEEALIRPIQKQPRKTKIGEKK